MRRRSVLALLLAALVTTAAPDARVVNVVLGPVQREIVRAIIKPTARFTDIEGALRSAKTWSILIGIRRVVEEHPGIAWTLSRWNQGDLNQKLLPDWRNVCALMGLTHGEWNAGERCYDFPNRSRVYAIHLKTNKNENRYAHVRGLTTAGFFLNQGEEVPEDVAEEAMLRVSQPGFPQLFVMDPNPVPESHWIAQRFPENNSKPDHRYIRVAMRDNRHNLAPETIAAAERLYPVGHPQRRTKLEGKRGLDVRGKPVYIAAFDPARHVGSVALNPELPLGESYDYGFHHPCVVWYQWAPWGHLRILGGVLGADMHLDEFLPIVEKYRALWFNRQWDRLDATCDPAGAAENSQGLRGTPVGILQDWYRTHGERDSQGQFVTPRFQKDANHPERRHAATETVATYMRRQVNGAEAFLVDDEHWVIAALGDERFDRFFLDGLEVGYVFEDKPRHSDRLGSFWIPKKDGFFEHPMNCLEYAVLADVLELPLSTDAADTAKLAHNARRDRDRVRALAKAQKDRDPDDVSVRRTNSRHGRGRSFARRGGY